LIRMATEDIGLADPRALRIALDAAETYERLGTPEGELALAQCVVYLAVAPKSNAVYKAFNEAKAFIGKDGTRPVPLHLRNAPTKLMKDLDYGKNYRYAHDEEGVAIVLAVVEILHQLGGRVAQVQGHRPGAVLADECLGFVEGLVDRIGFGRHRKVDDALRQ